MKEMDYRRFKELREENGLSQSQLARKIKSHPDVIAAADNGIIISVDLVRKYALFFDVTADYLLELTDVRK